MLSLDKDVPFPSHDLLQILLDLGKERGKINLSALLKLKWMQDSILGV